MRFDLPKTVGKGKEPLPTSATHVLRTLQFTTNDLTLKSWFTNLVRLVLNVSLNSAAILPFLREKKSPLQRTKLLFI